MQDSKGRFGFGRIQEWQRTLYITFAAQFLSVVGFSTIYPFLPLYVKSLGVRSSLSVELMAGLVFSSQAFTMMITAPIWGAIADRYGRRPMIQRAMFGGAITVLAMGFAGSAEMLVFLRAIQGLVTGTISAANALIAATVPRERIGYAMGLMQVALWGGVAIGPLLGGIMADAFGYRTSFVLTAISLGLGGIMMFAVRENFVPPDPETAAKRTVMGDWKHILSAPGVKVMYLARFMMSLGRTVIVPIAPLFVVTLLPDDAPVNFWTGLVIASGGLASTVTAVVLGRMGDRIGHRQILLFSSFFAALFFLPQGLVQEAWQLLLLQFIAGAGVGGLITSVTALLAEFTEPGEEGSVYGFDSALNAGSRVIAPLLGAGIAYWFSLRLALSFAGLIYLAIFVIVVWRVPRAHQQAVASSD